MGCALSRCWRGYPSLNVLDQFDGASDGKLEETIHMCVYVYTCMHNMFVYACFYMHVFKQSQFCSYFNRNKQLYSHCKPE